MRLNNETKKLIIDCWNDRNSGRHGWIKSGEMWLTIEAETIEDTDYIAVYETNKIDALGYCYGTIYNCILLDECDINSFNCLNDNANEIMIALQDEHDIRLFPDRFYEKVG